MSKKIICKICGTEFEWSDEEIQFYLDRNLVEPKRCPDCRSRRKTDKNTIAKLEKRIKELESHL
uniref:Probable zinc-binding domain-containing protein n=1 Tax=viral metagenome TaxID=1070528 RepID=A0A6M3JLB0_9ZZZZ